MSSWLVLVALCSERGPSEIDVFVERHIRCRRRKVKVVVAFFVAQLSGSTWRLMTAGDQASVSSILLGADENA